MKKFACAFLLVTAFPGTGFSQTKAPEAKAKGPSVAATIKQLEHEWTDAAKAGDADKLNQIIADDWAGVFYDGTKATKKEYIETRR